MNLSYKTHEEFAFDLLKFAAKCDENSKIDFRMLCGRLYYALYHKVLFDNKISSKSKLADSQIKIIDPNLRQRYKIFYDLRQWADYDLSDRKIQNKNNLISLCKSLLNKKLKCKFLEK